MNIIFKILKINLFLYLIFTTIISYSIENKIKFKINNEIITDLDIDIERNYLLALNPALKDLDSNQIYNISKNSILKEKIKKIELEKFFIIGENKDDKVLDNIIEGIYNNLGIKNETEFINYISKYNLDLNWLRNKIEIETLWNNLIFRKYSNLLVIDENKIKQELTKDINKNNNVKIFKLAEILVRLKNDEILENSINEISKSIDEIGFENTALIYSQSDTAKNGGDIGWIKETSLSPKIKIELEKIQKGEVTSPIISAQNFLLIKINDIKSEKKKIDLEKALGEKIIFEKNRQLEKYSISFFNRVKQGIIIDEK